MSEFELHPALQQDCLLLGHFDLCVALLMNDVKYPWVILVPQRHGVREIYELTEQDQAQLLRESSFTAKALARAFEADKMNVAALGNVVPQLHVHHVVRHTSDAAWPRPVWGVVPAEEYPADELDLTTQRIKACFGPSGFRPG